jgi:hypothetical protein
MVHKINYSKMIYLEFDFTNRRENNPESNMILKKSKDKINRQCRIVLEALQRGERLTVFTAMVKYGIGDMRRRAKDLRDNGFEIRDRLLPGNFKEYFL